MILEQHTYLKSNTVGIASDRLQIDGCILCSQPGPATPREVSYLYILLNTYTDTKMLVPFCDRHWESFNATSWAFQIAGGASALLGFGLLYLATTYEGDKAALFGVPSIVLIFSSLLLLSFFRNRLLPFRVKIVDDYGREGIVFTFRESAPAQRLYRTNAAPPTVDRGQPSEGPLAGGRRPSGRVDVPPWEQGGRPERPSGRSERPSGRQIQKPSGRQIRPPGRDGS